MDDLKSHWTSSKKSAVSILDIIAWGDFRNKKKNISIGSCLFKHLDDWKTTSLKTLVLENRTIWCHCFLFHPTLSVSLNLTLSTISIRREESKYFGGFPDWAKYEKPIWRHHNSGFSNKKPPRKIAHCRELKPQVILGFVSPTRGPLEKTYY